MQVELKYNALKLAYSMMGYRKAHNGSWCTMDEVCEWASWLHNISDYGRYLYLKEALRQKYISERDRKNSDKLEYTAHYKGHTKQEFIKEFES